MPKVIFEYSAGPSILKLLSTIFRCSGKLERYVQEIRLLLRKKNRLEMMLVQLCLGGYLLQDIC